MKLSAAVKALVVVLALHTLLLEVGGWAWPSAYFWPNFPALVEAFGDVDHGTDSWRCMEPAYRHLASGDPTPLYTAVFFDQETKFQYPPTSLLVFPAFEAMGLGPADQRFAFRLLTFLAFFALTFGAAALLVAAVQRTRGPDHPLSGAERGALAACGVVGVVTYYPAVKALTAGNVHAWIAAFAVLAMLAHVRGRSALAGVWLGLAALIKPQYGLIALWAIVRRDWAMAAGAGGTIGVALAASCACFGVSNHVNYLDALRFMGRHGETGIRNHTLTGLLNRLVEGRATIWRPDVFPPFHEGIYWATLAFGAALVATSLAYLVIARRAGGPLDLAAVILTATLASPIAWEYHYSVLLAGLPPAFAAVAMAPRPALVAVLAGAYVATAHAWFQPMAAAPAAPWNLYHASMFAGGLALLVLCYRMASPSR